MYCSGDLLTLQLDEDDDAVEFVRSTGEERIILEHGLAFWYYPDEFTVTVGQEESVTLTYTGDALPTPCYIDVSWRADSDAAYLAEGLQRQSGQDDVEIEEGGFANVLSDDVLSLSYVVDVDGTSAAITFYVIPGEGGCYVVEDMFPLLEDEDLMIMVSDELAFVIDSMTM